MKLTDKQLSDVLERISEKLGKKIVSDKDFEVYQRRTLKELAQGYMAWASPKYRICSHYSLKQLHGLMSGTWLLVDVVFDGKKYKEVTVWRPAEFWNPYNLPEKCLEWHNIVIELKSDVVSPEGHHFYKGERLVCSSKKKDGTISLQRIPATLEMNVEQTELFRIHSEDARHCFSDPLLDDDK